MEVIVVQIDVATAPEQPLRDGDRQDCVVGKPAILDEQGEVLRLGAGALVDRPDDIARDGSQHQLTSLAELVFPQTGEASMPAC